MIVKTTYDPYLLTVHWFLTGIKTKLKAIRRNVTRYTISWKGYNGWASNARNIFNFTVSLIDGNLYVT